MWSSSVKTGEQLSISGISAKELAVGLKIAELELMYAQEANLLLPWLLA